MDGSSSGAACVSVGVNCKVLTEWAWFRMPDRLGKNLCTFAHSFQRCQPDRPAPSAAEADRIIHRFLSGLQNQAIHKAPCS